MKQASYVVKYGIELDPEVFAPGFGHADPDDESVMGAYEEFRKNVMYALLGLHPKDITQLVAVEDKQFEVVTNHSEDASFYDMSTFIWEDRIVVAVMSRTLKGVEFVEHFVEQMKEHPAFNEVQRNPRYFPLEVGVESEPVKTLSVTDRQLELLQTLLSESAEYNEGEDGGEEAAREIRELLEQVNQVKGE